MPKTTSKPPAVMIDALGQTVPVAYVKPYDRARDRIARRIMARFRKAQAQLARLKAECIADIESLRALSLAAAATGGGGALGGAKGNIQFTSFDGLVRVRLDARTFLDYDERFRQAQELVVAYAEELAARTEHHDIVEIIRAAFRPTNAGMFSRARVTALFRLNIKAPQWLRAMDLLRESQFVKSGKSYLYCEVKPTLGADFEPIPLDLAAIDPETTTETPTAKETEA